MKPAPWPLDEPFPALMTPRQLMRVLQLGHAQFYALQQKGDLKFLEVKRPLGHARYSGELVRQYVNGESTVAIGSGARIARRGVVAPFERVS